MRKKNAGALFMDFEISPEDRIGGTSKRTSARAKAAPKAKAKKPARGERVEPGFAAYDDYYDEPAPRGDTVPNVLLFYGPEGKVSKTMPKSVTLPVSTPAKAIHMLSGVSGWGYPYTQEKAVSLIVRLHYAGGATEEHPLKNGEHFADYARKVDVPGSQHAFNLGGRQIRYLAIRPLRGDVIENVGRLLET